MRLLIALAALFGCNSTTTCKDAVSTSAKRFGTSDAPEVATLIGLCETTPWSSSLRSCVADATSPDALTDCLPSLDVKIPMPQIAPSNATMQMVAMTPEPVKALLFFEDKSDLGIVVTGYFKDLPKVAVEYHDRIVEPDLAAKYRVVREGSIVLVRGDRSQLLTLATDIRMAERRDLPRLDVDVADALHKLFRQTLRAYLTSGHGEITDPDSIPPELKSQTERKTTVLVKLLADLNYKVASLGPAELASDVPADASVVLVLAPATALSQPEQAALGRYLDRGGSLLYALDPSPGLGLDTLAAKLGVKFDPTHLADDKTFLPQRKDLTDHRIVMTAQFSKHPTTTAIARSATQGIVLLDAGSLEPVPSSSKVTFTITTMATTFRDTNHNFIFDGGEKRAKWNVAAAVEGASYRALVFADVDLFADALIQAAGRATVMMIAQAMFVDVIHWLAKDETFLPDTPTPPPADPVDARPRLEARLELVDRRILRALARAISEKHADDRETAAKEVRQLQSEHAELAKQLDTKH